MLGRRNERSLTPWGSVRRMTFLRVLSKRHHHFKDFTIKVAGFGGQGVLLLGQLLAEMGMREGLEVSWLPSYGPEMRSGSAHCHVCLSKERIGSPLISHPDVLIALNEISLRKFAAEVTSSGLILYNNEQLPQNFACTCRTRRLHSSVSNGR